jgi:hypothetical protein
MRFYSVTTRVFGVIGLVLVVYFIGVGVLDPSADYSPWVFPMLVFAGVMVWVGLLRQQLDLTPTTLEFRSLFTHTVVPLKLVEEIVLAQVFVVRAAGRRFVSAAIGRTRRQQFRDTRRAEGRRGFIGGLVSVPQSAGVVSPDLTAGEGQHYENLVVARIRLARDTARTTGTGPDDIVRTLAWPEIVLAAGSFVAFVVLLAV